MHGMENKFKCQNKPESQINWCEIRGNLAIYSNKTKVAV